MSDDRDLSALYRSSDKPQPPAALDAAIREAAHSAVKPKRSHAPQWLGGIAASLIAALLIVQLFPTVEQETGADLPATDAPESVIELHEAAPAGAPSAYAPAEAESGRARTSDHMMPKRLEMQQSLMRDKAAARKQADSAVSSASPGDDADGVSLSPASESASTELELQTIIHLLNTGRTREAKQLLDDFRDRYPDTDIPESITRRLTE